jgi:hypothetical protein
MATGMVAIESFVLRPRGRRQHPALRTSTARRALPGGPGQ